MEATIVYWGSIGVMEKKMETTTIGCQIAKVLAPLPSFPVGRA